MTDTQKERLDAIFKQRPQAQAVAAIEVNFSNEKTKDAVEAHKAQLLSQLDRYGSNNDLIQRVITIKKRIIENDVKKQIKVIDDAAAQRNAEEQCPQQIEEQRVDELEQLRLQEVQNKKIPIDQGENLLVNKTYEIPAQASVTQISEDVKTKLSNIISRLIRNISEDGEGRFTSSTDHKKVADLKRIQDILIDDKNVIKTPDEYINDIMNVCKVTGNALHFWSTPNSVDEFKALLKVNGIILSPENKSFPLQ